MKHFLTYTAEKIVSLMMDHPKKVKTVINNRYEILRVLGMGSYGIAYLTFDMHTNKKVVLKELKPSKRKMKKGLTAFHYEARILSILNHPQIPRLRKVCNEQHQFIVMDYVNGRTFEDLIFRDGLTFNELESFNILYQVLEIVKYIHENNIVHRDLRIPNIMVQQERIMIIDFGLARFINENNQLDDKIDDDDLRRQVSFQSDFYMLGHFILFLLYSSFSTEGRKEQSWEEELMISSRSIGFIRRLFQLDRPYDHVDEIMEDIKSIIHFLS